MTQTSSSTARVTTALLVAILLMATDAIAQRSGFKRTTTQQSGEQLGVGRLIPTLDLIPIEGPPTTLATLLTERPVVVISMTSTTCPLSKKYAPRLASLAEQYADRAAFVYVNTVAAETEANMQDQIREYSLRGLYLADRDQAVARALRARTTTEVFVIDAARTLVYRGAVDDQYGVGTSLDQPRRHFLRDALDAALDGERLGVRASWPPGCLLDLPRDTPVEETEVTYFGRVARIVADKCVSCHQRGGDAPFGLESPSLMRGRLSMIEAMVSDGLMPPWHEDPDNPSPAERWSNHRALTPSERADLLSWLRSSRPLGDPREAPVVPPIPPAWRIGTPELILSTPALDLPAEGPMMHARLITPTRLDQDRWLSDLELRPIKNDTVHHALVWILPPGSVLPGAGEIPASLELLGTFSPGDGVVRFREDASRQLLAGSILIVDLYALPMGRPMAARLRLGLKFADAPPAQQLRTRTVICDTLELPARTGEIYHNASRRLDEATELVAIWPYMRARGQSMRVEAALPNGRLVTLLNASNYDYRWQIRYEFARPQQLPAGTEIRISGTHDNRLENPNNPGNGEPAASGPGVTDDALFAVLEFVEPR